MPGLNLCPQGGDFFVSPLQVCAHFGPMPKIVRDDGMYVGEVQGLVSPHHVFGTHTVFVLRNDQVKADATRPHANPPTFDHAQRQWIGGQRQSMY